MIGDVVNVFGRADGIRWSSPDRSGSTSPAPSESSSHCYGNHRSSSTPNENYGELIRKDLDGLIREVALDKANGLIGKTVIHPSHVAAVHALSVVTLEEYTDAIDILGTNAPAAWSLRPTATR